VIARGRVGLVIDLVADIPNRRVGDRPICPLDLS
jgi:hypothetical protein